MDRTAREGGGRRHVHPESGQAGGHEDKTRTKSCSKVRGHAVSLLAPWLLWKSFKQCAALVCESFFLNCPLRVFAHHEAFALCRSAGRGETLRPEARGPLRRLQVNVTAKSPEVASCFVLPSGRFNRLPDQTNAVRTRVVTAFGPLATPLLLASILLT